MSERMYYIQNYSKRNSPQAKGISRFLSGEYMGSSEFEFGSVQLSWKILRKSDISLRLHRILTGEFGVLDFYVVSTEIGHQRFDEYIDFHLDKRTFYTQAKEDIQLRKKIAEPRNTRLPDAWLDVSQCVSAPSYQDDIEGLDIHPVFFSFDEELTIRLFLELKYDTVQNDTDNIHIGDRVYCYLGQEPFKVCGLNEDGSISAKQKYGKAIKFDPRDLWTFDFWKELPIHTKEEVF